MNWLSKQYSIDPPRLKHLVKFIFAYINVRQEDTGGKMPLKEIEAELLSNDRHRFEQPQNQIATEKSSK